MYYSGYDQSCDHYTKINDAGIFVELFTLERASDDAVYGGEEEYPESTSLRTEYVFESRSSGESQIHEEIVLTVILTEDLGEDQREHGESGNRSDKAENRDTEITLSGEEIHYDIADSGKNKGYRR